MRGRRPSVNDRVLLDVNAPAIYLVESHPGHQYIAKKINLGLRGRYTLLLLDYLPLRVHWVLTVKWNVPETVARDAIVSFLNQPLEIVNAVCDTMQAAYKIATEKDHDVFDCFYIALARQVKATAILTTDTDFKKLCRDEDFEYLNPVPEDVLTTFHQMEEIEE